jgi:hypothetical protein
MHFIQKSRLALLTRAANGRWTGQKLAYSRHETSIGCCRYRSVLGRDLQTHTNNITSQGEA